jgi:hypothetical protein
MKIIVETKKLEQQPFVLHEEIATGELGGKKIRVIRTVNGATMFVAFGDNHYQVNVADIVKAIGEAENV